MPRWEAIRSFAVNTIAVSRFIERMHDAFLEGDPQALTKQMEADNVRRMQTIYRAIARGDYAEALADAVDDIDLEIVAPPGHPFAGRWRGKAEVQEAIRRNFALVEDQRPEIQTLAAQGDTVVVVARERGRLRTTGQEYDLHFVQVFTFRDGKLTRMRELV